MHNDDATPGLWRLKLGRRVQLQAADGRCLALEGLAALLAARLALAGPQPRDLLARQLWPEAEAERARGNLRQRLLRLKTQAGRAWIDGQDRLALATDLEVERDSTATLLVDMPLPADDTLATWLESERRRWRQLQDDALQQRLQQAEAAQQLDAAAAVATEWVAQQPEAEAPRRALARLHYLRNDRARALDELDALAAMLRRVHDAEPSAASQDLRRLVERSEVARPRSEVPAALLRPPRLVGRGAELAVLHRVCAERGACLLLGEAGLGKSRLIADALAGRPASLAVKAQAGDAGVPYATLARLLRGLRTQQRPRWPEGAEARTLARLLPELLAPGETLPLPADGGRLLLCEALQTLWQRCGLAMVAVDDLHFADDASLELLQSLIADERLAGTAWLLAQRPGEGGAAARALRAALAEGGILQTLPLAPLDLAGVAELLDSLQLNLDAASWAPRLHRHTGGNPLFVLETLQQLQSADRVSGRLPPSATVGALIERRLQALTPAAIALARVAAVAGADFGAALAEHVSGRPALDLAGAWSELETAQVLRDRSFAHDLVLEAVQRGIPAPIREHLHAAVARHLQAHGGEPARIAAHWQAAQDAAAALPWLLRAADAAHAGLRPRETAEFLRLAAAACPVDAPERFELLMRWHQAERASAGRAAAAQVLDQAAAAAGDDAQRAAVLVRRAHLDGEDGDFEQAVAFGEQALALAQALAVPRHDLMAEALMVAASALALSGRAAQAETLLDRHWLWIERLEPQPLGLFSARAQALNASGQPQQARVWYQRAVDVALARGAVAEAIMGLTSLSPCLMMLGEIGAADTALQRAESLHQQHEGLNQELHAATGMRANALRDLGRYSAALAGYEASIAAESGAQSLYVAWQRVQRSGLWAAIGQWARAQQDLTAAAGRAGPPWFRSGLALAQLRLASARGQPVQAALDTAALALREDAAPFMTLQSAMLRLLFGEPGDVAGVLARAQACGYAGLALALQWLAAAGALRAGDAAAARRHALQCDPGPAGITPRSIAPGAWWHGLWRLWQGLDEPARADAARAEGVAWIHRTLQRELAPEFHMAFRDAVLAHRELLAG